MTKQSITLGLVLAGLALAVASPSIGTVRITQDPLTIPECMNLQGYLTDAAGNPVNGVKSIVFKIYRDGNLQWQEAQTCTVQAGLFHVLLGRIVPITPGAFEPGTVHELDINVEGQPLTPRVLLTSQGFAFRSLKSDSARYFSRPITPALTSSELADGAVTMSKIHQSGATIGQVIKWNGTSWAPAPDSVGGGSAGVTSVSQGSGIICTPNPITSTGSVAVNTSYLNERYIQNQDATTQSADFRIDGGGEAQQFYGASATSNAPGIWGAGRSYAPGVYGEANGALLAGVQAVNTHSSGTGLVGVGNNEQGTVLTAGSGGAFIGRRFGAFGYATNPSTLPIAGGYFHAAGPPDNYAYIAAWDASGYGYRCIGNGDCALSGTTRDGERLMFSMHSPAPCLEDRGRGALIEGHARIELDPHFLDCALITDSQPLDVFVQLNGDCAGVYVVTDRTGFDVYELNHGRSNTPFTWRAVAAIKGHSTTRFPQAPEFPATTVLKTVVTTPKR